MGEVKGNDGRYFLSLISYLLPLASSCQVPDTSATHIKRGNRREKMSEREMCGDEGHTESQREVSEENNKGSVAERQRSKQDRV